MMATFSEHLRARSDPELVDLLARRPDLADPSPSTIASLAARATSRVSLERALAGVDASVLQVLESVVALLGSDDAARSGGAVPAADVARAVGATAQGTARTGVDDAVAEAVALGLLWGDDAALRPSPVWPRCWARTPPGSAPRSTASRPTSRPSSPTPHREPAACWTRSPGDHRSDAAPRGCG
ncbi:hypothetical protein [Cellulomonas sp. ATA003]|uniref:hypothetical protein n=1 Tax=Cellulomonas sp. ATA003 TaxID=3073064 RepID=UPI00287321CC|nr:hypothetical protein [Cellulomonas sp. ATA003]WNB85261.1 hypothetical protein REH70_16760 [Cellulomonas sp. ATA003]